MLGIPLKEHRQEIALVRSRLHLDIMINHATYTDQNPSLVLMPEYRQSNKPRIIGWHQNPGVLE